ncbi:Uncharacterised protein [Pragia fontium]|nr:Uncharacterised protein [Pragia fontium]
MHITQRGLMGALFLCLSTLCNFIVRADSGIHLNQTRVIYSGANSIQNVTIGNQGGSYICFSPACSCHWITRTRHRLW